MSLWPKEARTEMMKGTSDPTDSDRIANDMLYSLLGCSLNTRRKLAEIICPEMAGQLVAFQDIIKILNEARQRSAPDAHE